MKKYVSDTSDKAHAVQISLLREASAAQRFACMASLSETIMKLSRRAIERAHPDYSHDQIDVAFVSLHYGKELASRLKRYLDNRTVYPL